MLMRRSAADAHDFVYSDVDNYVKELICCFYKFQNIFQYQILIFSLRLFFGCMCYIEFIVVSLKDRTFRITDDYIMIFLLIIDVLLLSLACVRCETFFREAKLTKRLSLSILAIYKDGLLRGRANRILKILEEHPPIFSVYHMWNLKASTLIQLISILTTIFFNILTLNYLE